MDNLTKRFINYVKIDTQSDPLSGTHPSTEKQKDLSRLLLKELKEMNINAFIDDYGYVYGHIPKTVENAKSIGFIAHVDTSFDAPGANVNPRIIKNYDGSKIILNDELSMKPKDFPSLSRVIGDDIIVTDGNTLLGADNKAGVAEIMELAKYFTENKKEHGDIYLAFTTDEEIGQGADFFNYDFFKADFAYTVDGGEVGGIDFENFNAASAKVTFIGKSIHPGSAKLQMVNATHLLMEFHSMLPEFFNPAYTDDRDGFNHLSSIKGEVEKAESGYIIRNHDLEKFNKQKLEFKTIQNYMNEKYGYNAVNLEIKDSYYNMYEKLKDHQYIIEIAKDAIKKVGLVPFSEPIRGGTDGARLTYEGLLCPNLGTGGYHFHGRFEFCSINQMHKSVEILKEIILSSTK